MDLNYQGDFKNGIFDGFGHLSYAKDVNIYEYTGEFSCGKYNGEGEGKIYKNYGFPNELIYTYNGKLKDGLEHGFGTACNKKTRKTFTGTFSTGKIDHGEMKHNQDYYIGPFKEWQPHGEGEYHFKTIGVYNGTFENGHLNYGKTELVNGDMYEGEFEDLCFHGKGTYTNEDGTSWSGEWVNDYFTGEGGYYDDQGYCNQYGIWSNDTYMGKLPETKNMEFINEKYTMQDEINTKLFKRPEYLENNVETNQSSDISSFDKLRMCLANKIEMDANLY